MNRKLGEAVLRPNCERMSKMKSFSMVLSVLLGAAGLTLPAGTGEAAPPAPLRGRPHASAPTPQAILVKAAAQLAKASSYQFEGPVKVVAGKGSPQESFLSGAWQTPSTTYEKSSGKAGTAESLVDAGKVYLRATGSLVASPSVGGQWYVAGYTLPKSTNPMAALQVAASSRGNLSLGADTQVNGKTCWTITSILDPESAKALLAGLGAGAGVTLDPKATSKASGKVIWYIDQATGLLEAAAVTGTQSTTIQGKSSTVTLESSLSLKGVNGPVSMPDVSSAKPLPMVPSQH